MSDSIREQIIDQIVSRMEIVREENGFLTDCGENVFRATPRIGPNDLDAITVFPRRETAVGEYDVVKATMPVEVQAIAEIGEVDSETEGERAERVSILREKMLADLIEAMTADAWSMAFTSGSREPVAGNTVTGGTSGATGFVQGVAVSSGSWAGGDAAGTITIRRKSGTFAAETINIGAELNVATITGILTRSSAIALVAGGFADGIYYMEGGADEVPELSEKSVGVSAAFNITYAVQAGNPFGQP